MGFILLIGTSYYPILLTSDSISNTAASCMNMYKADGSKLTTASSNETAQACILISHDLFLCGFAPHTSNFFSSEIEYVELVSL